MTDGQTNLMQQVVDRSASNVAGLFDLRSSPSAAVRTPQLPGHKVGATLPLLPSKHIGRLTRHAVDQPAVREVVDLLLRRQPENAFECHVEDLLARGSPVEHLYLRLFQPAARRLGELWAEDICSFVDVTLAMARLQSGLRRLTPQFHRHGRSADGTRSVLFGCLRGDQHTFGLNMVAEFFRRSGWSVRCFGTGNADELIGQLASERRAVVGFSASRVDQLPELAATIRHLRRHYRNRVAGILVGGPLFVTHPECVRDIGADAVGLDARQAVAAAENLAAVIGDCR